MTVRVSTGFRNGVADGAFNGGAGGNFNSGAIKIYTGAEPSSANDAVTGTLLSNGALAADAFGAASAGAVSITAAVVDASADNTGTAGYWRMVESTDTGGSSTTERRVQGSITATGGGGDITLNNTSIASGQQVSIDTFTITFPAS